ncbi:MAG: Yip1 family protein [Sphingomonas bacterium]
MATQIPGDQPAGMMDRIKRLLTAPAQEWPLIDAEPMTVKGIFMTWVIPLAAIGPIAHLIGMLVFGIGFFGITYRPSIGVALGGAVTMYVLALIGTFVMALVIDWLAPNFGATKNPVSAMKVVAFSMTAAWIAGIFQIIPNLGWLGLVGLYSLYLLWIGLPLLMKAPADKAPTYVIVSILVCCVAMVVVNYAALSISGTFIRPPLIADSGTVSGTMNVPGVGSVDLGKANEAVAKMKAATERMQADAKNGTTSAVPVGALQAMLPATIAGFTRGDVETSSGAAAGIGGSRAEGRYTLGDQSFSLSVADMGAMGSLATLGGAINAQSSKQTATGYEKTEMVGGSMVTEKWNTESHSGRYETMVASRFMVSANGNAPGIDTLKQAVATVDTGALASLAK